jgi:TolB protein
VNGRLDIYIVDAATAAQIRLTDDADDEIAPAWSADGAAVLFGARRAGTWQLIKLTLADRARTPLTTAGGYAPQPSPDGRTILFTRLEAPGVWSMPAEGGEARLLVPGVRAADTMNWRVTATGIYYVGATGTQVVVRRAPLSGGAAADVAWLGNYSWPGITITADGTRVIYARWDRRESNIIAMDPQ